MAKGIIYVTVTIYSFPKEIFLSVKEYLQLL